MMAIVVDDICTTGATMRRSLEAIRTAGVTAFGFGFSGV
jgi:predicted amidophosphoribosyltransferase